MKISLTALAATVLLAGLQARAQAQTTTTSFSQIEMNRATIGSNPQAYSADRIRSSVVNSALPRQVGVTNVNRGALSGALARPNKPFSTISKGPSVTPYLALDNPFTSSATSYYTQIRPQLEQQRMNEQMQQRSLQMQQQLQQTAAKGPYSMTGSETMTPTGHGAVYQNLGGYYTMPQQKR